MKLLMRVSIILIAAAVVAGVTLAIAQVSGAAQASPDAMRPPIGARVRPDSDAPRGAPPVGQRPAGGPLPNERERERGQDGFVLSGLLRSLGIISAIVAVYAIGGKLFAWLRTVRAKAQTHDAAAKRTDLA
jgi:hypothetical protein